MKNITYLLLFCSSYLHAQIDTLYSDGDEYGVFCFQEIQPRPQSEATDSSQFLIRFIEPQFEKEIINFSYSDIDSIDLENGYLEVIIKPRHSRYFRYEYYEHCLDSKNGICIKKIPELATFKKIMLDSLVLGNIPIEVFSLVSNGRTEREILQKAPEQIQENETFFSLNIWSNLREMACCLIRGPIVTFKQIEEALFERGYPVIFNEKVDTVEKSSLTHFQKENGLPSGGLNMETLKALNLHY